jgi:YesN/AraC family two-component response regulator
LWRTIKLICCWQKIGKENNAKLYHFEATDGKKAIKLYKKQKLDVILMDIQMPKKMALKLLLQLES